MHKELNSIAIFIAVVDQGGFSKAAEKLSLSKSVVSHHVTKLEKSLGVNLLYRSTRKVTLSDQGREFYTVASNALKLIEDASNDLETESSEPSGKLNIAMPAFVPDPRLQELIWDFTTRYEDVDLNISFSDDQKKLIEDGFDLAFRVGELGSSSMISRKIADIDMIMVASKEYVEKAGSISQPSHIIDLDCISLNQLQWKVALSKGNMNEVVQIKSKRIGVDNIYAARDAAVAGLGLIPLPLGLCQQEIDNGSLVQVLPEWQVSPVQLHAVWSNKARRNSLTRRLLSFISDNY